MRKLFYCGLEPYQERYTLQLTEWNRRVFERRGVDVVYVPGLTLDNSLKISVGQVLDAHGRSYFSMSQMMNVVRLMQQGEITGDDVIYFEDMFSPGIESLPYILNQVPEKHRPRVFVRCLAQAVDPDDFVHVWGMADWMRHYEMLVNSFATVLATNEEMVAHMHIAGYTAPIYNISGLAFGKDEVQSRVSEIKPFAARTKRVAFTARFDQEKQPNFFMDLVERYLQLDPSVEFAIFSGGTLRSNDQKYVDRARQLESAGKLKIYEGLQKNEYYELLADTRVGVNCALQDWTSNTVSEADALGCNVLFPAYRSFPEVFANDHERLYIPWSLDDATAKLSVLLEAPHRNMGKISDWNDKTIDRVIDIIQGNGEQWRRNSRDYRNYVSQAKY